MHEQSAVEACSPVSSLTRDCLVARTNRGTCAGIWTVYGIKLSTCPHYLRHICGHPEEKYDFGRRDADHELRLLSVTSVVGYDWSVSIMSGLLSVMAVHCAYELTDCSEMVTTRS